MALVIPQALGAPEEISDMIANAVLEAARNAMGHGNGFNHGIPTAITFARERDTMVINIVDQGSGFDPSALEDPTVGTNILRSCGRGIFLMRAFMDSVEFGRKPDGGTIVTLTKSITPIPETGE